MKSYEENLYSLEMVNAVRKLSDSYADRLAQVEKERDAAVKDISEASRFACSVCTENDWPNCKAGNYWNMNDEQPVCCEHFKWRGVCAENTEEALNESSPDS